MGYEQGEWIMRGLSEDDPYCLKSPAELVAYVKKVGFLPLFRNDIPGFSVEERTVPYYWWTDDASRDPWQWREQIADGGEVAYGKFFGKKAGFVSLDWLPDFANYRRDGYDFDALWDDEKASARDKKIMDLFESKDELFSFEMKRSAGFGKDGEKNFEGTVTALQIRRCTIGRNRF